MRREFSWLLTIVVAFVLALLLSRPYARLLSPYYAAVARTVASFHPWQVDSVGLGPTKAGNGQELQLHAVVRTRPDDGRLVRVTGRVQVGEVVETPLVYFTLLFLWNAGSRRELLLRWLLSAPILLLAEAFTTAVQLMWSMSQASALLAGDTESLTGWDRWSRFLEAGGGLVIAVMAALVTVTLAAGLARHPVPLRVAVDT